MLRMFYKSGIYTYRISCELSNEIKAGMVASFSIFENKRITVCKNGMIPCGFFASDYNPILYHAGIRYLNVTAGPGEYSTDIFEPSLYKINDYLYCSKNGRITNESKYKGSIIIGLVNSISDDEIVFLTLFARNLE
jgi:hypothetical protein